MLINEIGRLIQCYTPIFVKRNKFLEVLSSIELNLTTSLNLKIKLLSMNINILLIILTI